MDQKLDWLHYRGKSPAGDQSALCRPAPGPALTFPSFILLTKITAPACQEFSCLAKSSLQSHGVFLPFHFRLSAALNHQSTAGRGGRARLSRSWCLQNWGFNASLCHTQSGFKIRSVTTYLHCEVAPCLGKCGRSLGVGVQEGQGLQCLGTAGKRRGV